MRVIEHNVGPIEGDLRKHLKEQDIAAISGVSLATVRRWRLFRRGPRYKKIGSAVRYDPADVNAWLESLPTGGSETEAA